MVSTRSASIASGGLWLGLVLTVSACNCGVESASDAGAGDSGTAFDSGTTTDSGSALDAGEADAGPGDADAGNADAGSSDAGAPDGGGLDAGFTPGRFFSFRLVYRPQAETGWVPPPFADLCVRPINDTAWTRVYGPPGIGIGEVGRQHRVSGGNWAFKIIDVSESCDGPGVYQSSQVLGNDSTHKRVTINFVRGRIMGVTAREQFSRFDDSMLGRQDWVTTYPDSAASNVFFSIDGGAPVRLDTTVTRFDGGVVGAMTFGSMSVDYRTGTGTATSVFFNAFMPTLPPVFCDDFAPTAGVLASCSTNLRPP